MYNPTQTSGFPEQLPSAQQGWQCPVCKRVYSPLTSMCLYCGGSYTPTITCRTGSSDRGVSEMEARAGFYNKHGETFEVQSE